jgi:hypothetical protein
MRISFRGVLLALVIVGGAAYGIARLRDFHNLGDTETRRQIRELQKENAELQNEIAARQNFLTRLQQNPDLLKLEIERRLKLVSPGTKQFILQDGVNAGSRSDTPAPDTEPRP